MIARLWAESDQTVMLAAALAVRGTRIGHVCIRLESQREAMVIEGQPPEVVEALPWPDPEEWVAAVSASRMVGDGRGEEPLVLEGDRLYLERYFRYEEQVVNLIGARTAAAAAREVLTPESRTVLDELLPPLPDNGPNLQHAAAVNAMTGRLTVVAGGPGTARRTRWQGCWRPWPKPPQTFRGWRCAPPPGKRQPGSGRSSTIWQLRRSVRSSGNGWRRCRQAPSTGSSGGRGAGAGSPTTSGTGFPTTSSSSTKCRWSRYRWPPSSWPRCGPTPPWCWSGTRTSWSRSRPGRFSPTSWVPPPGHPTRDGGVMSPAHPAIADCVVVLERVHRFEEQGPIADFADAVRDGDPDRAMELLDRGVDDLHWVKDRTEAGIRRLRERVAERRARLVEAASVPGSEEEALARLGEMGVLCANRDGPGSVEQWRRDIENTLDERFPGLRYRGEWYPGRPLMITRNDYNLGLYNGTSAWWSGPARACASRSTGAVSAPSHPATWGSTHHGPCSDHPQEPGLAVR